MDDQTGYRYYGDRQIDKARIITRLRSLEFPLEQIGEMLTNYDDEADVLDPWSNKRRLLREEAAVPRHRGFTGEDHSQ